MSFLVASAVISNHERLQTKCTIKTSRSRLSILFGQEAPDLHSVTMSIRKINLYDTPV